MNYIIDSLNKFYKLPIDVKEKIGGIDSMLVIKNIENDYGVDISFALILIAIGELDANDLPVYLQKKYSLSADDSYDAANEVTRKIFSKFFYIDNNNNKTDQSLLISEFNEGLFDLFKDSSRASIFNNNVFKVLTEDASFLNKLEKSLLENKLFIGDKSFLSSGRKLQPSVSNWIKDFLTINGTDSFSDIDLIRYITNNKNAKNLFKDDKTLLFKVLKTYANIAFFLENSNIKPLSSLEFIPISSSDIVVEDKLLSDNTNNKIDLKTKKDDKKLGSSSDFKSSDLGDLQKILSNYDYNSLEYKAIKQEIDRLHKMGK